LARDDWKITNKKMKDWTYPTPAEIGANEQQVKRLSDQVINGGNGGNGGRNSNSGGNRRTADSDSDSE
jgi:hypothetical protein